MPGAVKRNVVGIGAVCAASGEAEMVAYALGSCVALCLYDPDSGVGAMAHVFLPSRGRADGDDTKYADHALACALRRMRALGADAHVVVAALVGGAAMFPLGGASALNIGKLNVESVSSELQKNGIPLKYAVTGGTKSRTVTFRIPGDDFCGQIAIRGSSERSNVAANGA